MSEWFLSVAVPRPVKGLFSYRINQELAQQVEFGSVVQVPFGKTKTHAFVVVPPQSAEKWSGDYEFEKLKYIDSIDTEPPALTPEIFKLCEWTANYYQAALGEVMNCALPRATLGLKNTTRKPRKRAETIQQEEATEARIVLNPEQKEAISGILKVAPQATLLEGVTGSGKTEVYLNIVQKYLEDAKGVLVLVPEIALTPQMVSRFLERFPGRVAMWHSALPAGERRDLLAGIRSGKFDIVIGARSAIFAPVKNLGLIIIDEEHDASYKQEDRVRYHARDLAFVRAHQQKVQIVFGSATPSLETLEKAAENKISHFTLSKQATEIEKADIEIVSLLEEEMVPQLQTPFAEKTLQTIRATLLKGDQVLILLNRKGFAQFLLCTECRWVANCSQCSTSMTVHRRGGLLRCHTCGAEENTPHQCPKCQGTALQAVGCGTESLEEELSTLFSDTKSLRLDRDKITSQSRLEKILSEFRTGKAQILFGTQMLAKGHDFPGVQLVVVVLADGLFRFPDFRAGERALQALLQVAGRAGRHHQKGKVLIQTFDPEHTVLEVLTGKKSVSEWRKTELEQRKAAQYPPFSKLVKIRVENTDLTQAQLQAEELVAHIHKLVTPAKAPVTTLGPSEAFIARVKGVSRFDILVKSSSSSLLLQVAASCREFVSGKKWQCIVDMDPVGLN